MSLTLASAGSMVWFISAWAALAAVSVQYITARGLHYVDWPRLNKPDEAIYYGAYTAPSQRVLLTPIVQRGLASTRAARAAAR